MTELKRKMEELGFQDITTILNSGNLIFTSEKTDTKKLEALISENLEKTFGFVVPVIVRSSHMIKELYKKMPFKDEKITKEIRLYSSFLKGDEIQSLATPWVSDDKAFKIIEIKDRAILSVLDLSISKTIQAMKILEELAGKDITTRNWNTVERIIKKLPADA